MTSLTLSFSYLGLGKMVWSFAESLTGAGKLGRQKTEVLFVAHWVWIMSDILVWCPAALKTSQGSFAYLEEIKSVKTLTTYTKCLCTVNLTEDKLLEFIIHSSPKLENLLCAMHCTESWETQKNQMKALPASNSESRRKKTNTWANNSSPT